MTIQQHFGILFLVNIKANIAGLVMNVHKRQHGGLPTRMVSLVFLEFFFVSFLCPAVKLFNRIESQT